MGTFTSQILVGQKHSYDGGIINISHTLYLSENSCSAWILTPAEGSNENKQSQEKIVWIPTLENMLEDALVMIGLYVLKDEKLASLAGKYFQQPKKQNVIQLYDDIKPEDLQELYKHERTIESSHKIILSVFQGSSILKHLPVLKNYQNDIEVCKSIFTKEFSMWNRRFEESGGLEE
jgi:hypothetical protein